MKTFSSRIALLASLFLLSAWPAHFAHAATSLSLSAASDQYVDVPASASLTPSPLTFEAWINPTEAKCNTIIARGSGESTSDYILNVGYNGTNCGVMNIGFFLGGAWDSSASLIPLNTWTHVAVTYDGSNKQFYINGVLDRTAPGPIVSYSSVDDLYIGRQGTTCNCNFFEGELAEVRIWNTVRTASQINSDMTVSPDGAEPGLVAYYHLDQGSGTNVIDASGNGHASTLINGAFWTNSAQPSLGIITRCEGPGSGSDSAVLYATPTTAWTATANSSWLHISPATQSGSGSTNVVFSFDANTGPTRTGTLTIARQTLTVTQGGSNYVAASPLTALVSSGLSEATGIALDAAGNVYIGDNATLKEWSVPNNTLTTLAQYGVGYAYMLAADRAGNIYIADDVDQVINKWSAGNQTITTIVSNEINVIVGVATDEGGNVYVALDLALQEWSAASGNLTTLFSSAYPIAGVAVDHAGYIVFSYNGLVDELDPANGTVFRSLYAYNANAAEAVAVDGAGNIYFTTYQSGIIYEWVAATGSFVSPMSLDYVGYFQSVAVDGAGNVYAVDPYNQTVYEAPRAFVDLTPKVEAAVAGSDVLPVVLPATENLGGPLAPSTTQSWLTIAGVTNGVVRFSFSNNYGPARTAYITLLGQQIPVTQNPPTFALGSSTRVEGPGSGMDSVVLAPTPAMAAWTATNNASWLHLSAANQNGTGSTNIIFSFDANTGPTRTGTLTIAGLTFTVTQAASTYVAAPAPLTTLVSSGLNRPSGVAVDGAGNVYIADSFTNAIKEWSVATGSVTTLISNGLHRPDGVAVDGAGNVYIADTLNNAIKEWVAGNHTVITLVSSNLNEPGGVAVDGAGNVYIADTDHNLIKEWLVASNTVVTLDSSVAFPDGVAVDAAGNVYVGDTDNASVDEWSVVTQNASVLASAADPLSAAVDGAGNVYFSINSSSTVEEWVAASNTVITVVPSGLNFPWGLALDGTGNLYIADSDNSAIKELPRAFLDATTKLEGFAAGNDSLPMILPATENLRAPFAPTSDQSWLAITGISNGVVGFSFTQNTGAPRTAHISLLGESISVIQYSSIGARTLLTGTQMLTNGAFRFSFTNYPGATFTILTATNVSLPLSKWTPLGAPTENPAGQYTFSAAASTNSEQFYTVRSP